MERERIEIIIVSHKRADRVLTQYAVARCKVCVPESQHDDYARHNPNLPIITHPDSVIGLPAKRQWILDNYGSVFMLDDDLKDMRAIHRPAGVKNILTPEQAREVILGTAHAARQAGAYLYGFNSSCNPTNYTGHRPIVMSGFCVEGWIGIHSGSKLFYPRDLMLCGDYWIACLNAYYHRIVWRDDRFSFFPVDTFKNPGGQSEFRNMEREKDTFEYLKRHFGDAIDFKKDTVTAKRKHAYQKSLNLPF